MSDITEMLARVPMFGQLTGDTLQQLAATATITHSQQDEVICVQGVALRGLHVLIAGYIKLYRQSGERTQILALLRTGDCFGTEALSDDMTSPYYAAALAPVTLVFIPVDTMLELMQTNPTMRIVLLQTVTKRLRQFAALVHDLAFRDVTARLAGVIIAQAQQDGIVTKEGIRVPRLMTQSDLATMIGAAREVVQRTLKKLEDEQILQVSRKEFLILKIDQLRRIAAEENR